VSVVIPTYNRAHILRRALESAIRECHPGDEVLVVDDGSTDDTEAVVASFGPPIRYLRGEHRGAGAARNTGIRAAAGDLVAFLDSDDEWITGKLSWQRAILEAFPSILFLFSNYGRIDESGERLAHQICQVPGRRGERRGWSEILGPGISSATVPGIPKSAPPFTLYTGRLYETLIHFFWYVCTCTLIARRKEAGDALHFAEDVATFEDLECFARLAQRGEAGYMDCDTFWNHGHRGVRLTDADPVARVDAVVKIIERIWGSDQKYLQMHRHEYEGVMDKHRRNKVRYLLSMGRQQEARWELDYFFAKPWGYSLLSRVPRVFLAWLVGISHLYHSLIGQPGSLK
jgi:glycosyltransferase involved in cell wall biosynthesis